MDGRAGGSRWRGCLVATARGGPVSRLEAWAWLAQGVMDLAALLAIAMHTHSIRWRRP